MGVDKGTLETVTNVALGQYKRQHGVSIRLSGTALDGSATDSMTLLMEDANAAMRLAALLDSPPD
jgi:hypothetical protein